MSANNASSVHTDYNSNNADDSNIEFFPISETVTTHPSTGVGSPLLLPSSSYPSSSFSSSSSSSPNKKNGRYTSSHRHHLFPTTGTICLPLSLSLSSSSLSSSLKLLTRRSSPLSLTVDGGKTELSIGIPPIHGAGWGAYFAGSVSSRRITERRIIGRVEDGNDDDDNDDDDNDNDDDDDDDDDDDNNNNNNDDYDDDESNKGEGLEVEKEFGIGDKGKEKRKNIKNKSKNRDDTSTDGNNWNDKSMDEKGKIRLLLRKRQRRKKKHGENSANDNNNNDGGDGEGPIFLGCGRSILSIGYDIKPGITADCSMENVACGRMPSVSYGVTMLRRDGVGNERGTNTNNGRTEFRLHPSTIIESGSEPRIKASGPPMVSFYKCGHIPGQKLKWNASLGLLGNAIIAENGSKDFGARTNQKSILSSTSSLILRPHFLTLGVSTVPVFNRGKTSEQTIVSSPSKGVGRGWWPCNNDEHNHLGKIERRRQQQQQAPFLRAEVDIGPGRFLPLRIDAILPASSITLGEFWPWRRCSTWPHHHSAEISTAFGLGWNASLRVLAVRHRRCHGNGNGGNDDGRNGKEGTMVPQQQPRSSFAVGAETSTRNGLQWLFRWTRGDLSFHVPVRLAFISFTTSAIEGSNDCYGNGYWTRILATGCLAFLPILTDIAYAMAWDRQRNLASYDNESEKEKGGKGALSLQIPLPSRQRKSRAEALAQSRLMKRRADAIMAEEEVGGGLIVEHATYGDAMGRFNPPLNVTVPLRFWVNGSRLELAAGPRWGMMGFCNVNFVGEEPDWQRSVVRGERRGDEDISGIDRTTELSPLSFSPLTWAKWFACRWIAIFGEDKTFKHKSEEKEINYPILFVRYRISGVQYEVMARDDEVLVLPSPYAKRIQGR